MVASSAWAPSLLGVQRAFAPLPRAPAVACDAIFTLGPTPYLHELRAHTRRALTELDVAQPETRPTTLLYTSIISRSSDCAGSDR